MILGIGGQITFFNCPKQEENQICSRKKDQKWAYTECKFRATGWLLLIVGLTIVLLELASE
jgi:hypothetical protein